MSEFKENFCIDNEYRLLECIGSGGFGEVWKAQSITTKCECALKIIKIKSQNEFTKEVVEKESIKAYKQKFKTTEIKNLVPIEHVHSIGVGDTFALYYIMPLAKDEKLDKKKYVPSTLETKVQNNPNGFSDNEIATYFDILYNALFEELGRDPEPLHHNDVKPANLMFFDNDILRLGDFSLTSDSSGNAGTYMPPKIFMPDNPQQRDIWGMFCVLFYMITGSHPPVLQDIFELILMSLFKDFPKDASIKGPIKKLNEKIPELYGHITEKGEIPLFVNVQEYQEYIKNNSQKAVLLEESKHLIAINNFLGNTNNQSEKNYLSALTPARRKVLELIYKVLFDDYLTEKSLKDVKDEIIEIFTPKKEYHLHSNSSYLCDIYEDGTIVCILEISEITHTPSEDNNDIITFKGLMQYDDENKTENSIVGFYNKSTAQVNFLEEKTNKIFTATIENYKLTNGILLDCNTTIIKWNGIKNG